MQNKQKRKSSLRRISALLVLVGFIFGVLLLSYIIGGFILYGLIQRGLISPPGERNWHYIFMFLLLMSLGIATILSALGGTIFLRPLRELIAATREVAAGNFDIRVEPSGPYEMQRLTHSFNEMTRELGSIETLQSDFVNNVSHEFKTPVASIRGFTRLLKRDNLTEAQRNEYLDIILLEAERMAQLSGNVLLLSNLDNIDRPPDVAEFSLDEQLRQVTLLLEPLLEKKRLEVEVELESVSLRGSEELLGQVWRNLLNNAVKFTPEGGTIRIKAEKSGNFAVVTIADSGIGMSEEVRARLFDKFYQGDASRATQGNGLGLPLVRRILELSGGEISVKSREGEGSAFTVKLPV